MPRRKPIELIQESTTPRALIVGGKYVAQYLSQQLRANGCETCLVPDFSSTTGAYQYIFHFGGFARIESGIRHLASSGKYLFIESDADKPFSGDLPARTKVLRIGDPNIWSPQELTEKILKSTFSHTSEKIIDARKKSSIIKPKISPPSSSSSEKKVTIDISPSLSPKPKKEISSPLPDTSSFLVHKTRRINFKKISLILFSVLCSLSLVVGGLTYWYYLSLENLYTNFRSHVSRSSWLLVENDLSQLQSMLRPAHTVYSLSYTVLVPFRDTPFMKDAGTLLVVFENILTTSRDALALFSEFKFTTTSSFDGGIGTISKSSIEGMEGKIDGLSRALADGEKRINALTLPFFQKDSLTLFLSTARDRLSSVRALLPLVADLFTCCGTKTYLIILQNNFELRPTGGFIGSFGLLTVKEGRVIDFKVMDVYTADGQLRGHVDPPPPIRKYLSQPNWFLRDSNFDPDFATSSVQAAWFLEKELGTKVDGVIGVNLFVASDLLRVVGPLTLSDFNNEVVSADNFFFKAQYFTGKDFFPGSTLKKDFLTGTINALETQLLQSPRFPVFELVAVVKKALEEKNILFYSFDEPIQKRIEKEGWGGRMTAVSCSTPLSSGGSCFADYLSVVEANLGVNKANYFVEKAITIEKKIGKDGMIESIVSLAYENKGVPAVLTSDPYSAYIRVFTPLGSKLVNITLNTVPIAPNDIDTEQYGTDKTVFGFFIRIAPDNKALVKITYTLPSPLSSDSSSYQLFFQKQGGDKTSPLIFSLVAPSDLPLAPVNFTSRVQREEEIYYTTDTSVDRVFALGKKEL